MNLSVAEPVENVAPAMLISTGDSNPFESDTSEINPSFTLPLDGTIANTEDGVDPICIVTDLEPSV